MNKKHITYTVIFSIIFVLLSGCNPTGNVVEKEIIVLGYCPTMSNLAKDIQSKNSHVSLQPLESTNTAFQALNNALVDIVLVGRVAEKSELNNASELRLRDGLTLAGLNKRTISPDELRNSRIHTSVSETELRKYLPDSTNIVYHDSIEDAIKYGAADIVLISWEDYSDNLQLVIPVDDNMNKIEKFRLPVLYSYHEQSLQMLDL